MDYIHNGLVTEYDLLPQPSLNAELDTNSTLLMAKGDDKDTHHLSVTQSNLGIFSKSDKPISSTDQATHLNPANTDGTSLSN